MLVRLAQRRTAPLPPGYNASVATTMTRNVRASTALQASNGGAGVLLTVGAAKDAVLRSLPAYLAEARKYPVIKGVYLYDELFYEDGRIAIGAKEDRLLRNAALVRAAGLRSAVTVLPEVVMDPRFRLKQPNAFDIIGIDIYPSLGAGWDLHGCTHNANLYTTALRCSLQRLRSIGFTGEVWYVYQAFGDREDAQLEAHGLAQQETIGEALSFGVTGLVVWGLYDDSHTNLLPPLYPGAGTAVQPYVDFGNAVPGGPDEQT
jgi:hypothetical protein